MKKVAIFASGNGSNFEAIVRYFENKDVEFLCVSDKKDAYVFERAKNCGVQSVHVPFKETADFLRANKFDLVVLAGYMRILSAEVLRLADFINIHPSLLPSFKGMHGIKDAYDYGVKVTGVSVHYVNEEVDAGKIIAQVPVFIEEGMSLEALEEKIHHVEHKLYPVVVNNLLFSQKVDYGFLTERV